MASNPIYTLGYGNLGFEKVLERLRDLKATHVVDVRKLAGSKYWVDFRRPRIDDLLAEAGLRYIWMGDTLGGVQDDEPYRKPDGSLDWREIWALPARQKGIARLLEAANRSDWTICLMCGCLRAEECHRGLALGPVLLDQGCNLQHLTADGKLVPQTELLKDHQISLFD